MTRRFFLFAAAAVLAARPAAGQNPLTLDTAVADALARNARVATARAAVSRAGADVTIARSALFPALVFSESWQRGTSPVFAFSSLLGARQFTAADFAVDRLNHPGARSAFTTRIQGSQILFDGGRALAGKQASASAHDAAAADLAITEAAVAVDVVRTFGRVLVSEAAERAASTAVAAAREDLTRAERRRDAGTVTEADVLAITVHLARAEELRLAAIAELATARAELNRVTGAPVDRGAVLVAPPPPATPAGDLTTLLAEAETARPEIARAAAAEARLQHQVRAAKAGWSPQVAVRASWDATGLAFSDRAGAWMAGAEMTWTLSAGGAEAARVRAASADLEAARAQAVDVRSAVHVDVIGAYRRLDAARARFVLGERTIVAAREAHRILRNRYDSGLATIADLVGAAAAELDAERARTAALVDALVADADLRRSLGRRPGPATP